MATHKMLIDGNWLDGKETITVKNPYDGSVLGTVPRAGKGDVDGAIQAAEKAFVRFRETPAWKRAEILKKTSGLIAENRHDLGVTIAREAGKAMKYSLLEVDRAIQTFEFAAEEARRIGGEVIPLDAARGSEGRFGYFIREPIGVIGAISPFNFPLNLVAHKVAPAIAAGNTLVLKPATATPLTAVKLGELMLEAGLPAGVLNIIFGSGSTIGEMLVKDNRLAMITFTGSPPVGRRIREQAGLKKVTLELGNNSAVIVDKALDWGKHMSRFTTAAYANSGQMCISLQRIYVRRDLYADFVCELVAATKRVKVGDPVDPEVDVGPMIDSKEVDRIESWVKEAAAAGAQIVCGGKREGNVYHPTVMVDVPAEAKLITEEAFAPLVSVIAYDDFDSALEAVDKGRFGLQAGVFTDDLGKAFAAIKKLRVGGVMINDLPTYRADHMPYGGMKESGTGREGPRFAIEEMTEIKMVCFKLD